jgi:hypothetical protein
LMNLDRVFQERGARGQTQSSEDSP